MLGFFKRLFRGARREGLDDLSATTTHSQKSRDTESRSFLIPQGDLIPPFALNTYLETYLTDDLAHAIIDATVHLTIAPVECVSEDDALCEYIDEFHRRIDLLTCLTRLIHDAKLYGFGVAEIVGNAPALMDSTQILGLKRIDPRYLIIRKDQFGRITAFVQRPSYSLVTGSPVASAAPTPFERVLDPASIVYIVNHSPFTSYGESLLEPIKGQLERRRDLLKSATKAARNHANPVNTAQYTTAAASGQEIRETADEVAKHGADLAAACRKQEEEDAKWIVSAGKGEHRFGVLGHPNLPDITPLIAHVTTSALVAVGLNPQSLGFTFGSTATSFEASDRMLINGTIAQQRSIVSQLQSKLYRVLPLIETECPDGEIIIRMQPPTAESAKERLEAEAIRINNVERLWRNGAYSDEQGARELGLNGIADKERFEDWLNTDPAQPNPNDPNKAQAVDAATRSLNKGKTPSNNPTGRKGEKHNANSNGSAVASRFNGDTLIDK